MTTLPIIEENNFLEIIAARPLHSHDEYYAFYSSWFGGIIKDPKLMLLPIDDHMVHRGDGVFEAMKAVKRSVYLMDEHLQRLFISAGKIALKTSLSLEQMKHIILETLRAANRDDVIIRIFLSRGPGSFSPNPYDSIESQFYVIITELKTPPREKYEKGVLIGKSDLPIKSSWMAQVKSCNYLPNVLMKKEAVDRGLDFVIGVDADKHITESATENVMIVDPSGTLMHPPFDNILRGTTMIRACELAREHGLPTDVKSISVKDLQSAREVIMVGTTLSVLPVVKFENYKIGTGMPGEVCKKLNELLKNDLEFGPRRTSF